MSQENYSLADIHRTNVDKVVLVSETGKPLTREDDIDVWFDSGAMPYAQIHYPFENKDSLELSFRLTYCRGRRSNQRMVLYASRYLHSML